MLSLALGLTVAGGQLKIRPKGLENWHQLGQRPLEEEKEWLERMQKKT